jgi:hypothetical protein
MTIISGIIPNINSVYILPNDVYGISGLVNSGYVVASDQNSYVYDIFNVDDTYIVYHQNVGSGAVIISQQIDAYPTRLNIGEVYGD